jgi:hypothetical protein
MADLIRRVCAALAAHLPVRVIEGRDGSPFLSKYLIAGGAREGWRLHLHRFHRGDEDPEMHNHPWWCASLILAGGYIEERLRADGAVVAFDRGPGSVNVIGAEVFHRVDLSGGECWTVFLNAPASQRWGFINRHARHFVPWREFIQQKGMVPNG